MKKKITSLKSHLLARLTTQRRNPRISNLDDEKTHLNPVLGPGVTTVSNENTIFTFGVGHTVPVGIRCTKHGPVTGRFCI